MLAIRLVLPRDPGLIFDFAIMALTLQPQEAALLRDHEDIKVAGSASTWITLVIRRTPNKSHKSSTYTKLNSTYLSQSLTINILDHFQP